MCVSLAGLRMWAILFCYLLAEAKTYPMQAWPVYPAREYDTDYYYAPKVQYYYDAPAISAPEVYGQLPYYYYDPYGHFAKEAPQKQEERLAALPIGQETWFESEPRWRSNDIDDVNAAFLDNLILTQMAQDAQRRRENARAAFSADYEEKEPEDEDVRELKALAGKPFYHVPKTVPRIEDEDYEEDDADVDADSDGFINWNGNKRSPTTAAPEVTTVQPRAGQKEVVMPRPAQNSHHKNIQTKDNSFYKTLAQILNKQDHEATKGRRIDKRFVADDSDLVVELRGLKQRIAT